MEFSTVGVFLGLPEGKPVLEGTGAHTEGSCVEKIANKISHARRHEGTVLIFSSYIPH